MNLNELVSEFVIFLGMIALLVLSIGMLHEISGLSYLYSTFIMLGFGSLGLIIIIWARVEDDKT